MTFNEREKNNSLVGLCYYGRDTCDADEDCSGIKQYASEVRCDLPMGTLWCCIDYDSCLRVNIPTAISGIEIIDGVLYLIIH